MTLRGLQFRIIDLLQINRLFRWKNRGKIKVLLYHALSGYNGSRPISVSEFRSHLQYLKRHFAVVALSQGGAWAGYDPNRVNVLLTFDDGFEDNYSVAFPELVKERISATFLLISDLLPDGGVPSFALANRAYPAGARTISVLQAREMSRAGMTIGSHSRRHSDFRLLPPHAVLEDAEVSRGAIGRAIDAQIGVFAVPWGRVDKQGLAELSASFARVLLTEHGFNSPEDKVVRRNEITDRWQMRAAASGALDFVKALWRRPTPLGKPVRVLAVIETLGIGGGAERLIASLLPGLREGGVEVEIVALFSLPDDLGAEIEQLGFRVHRFELLHRWAFFQAIPRLAWLLRRGQFDVVWGHLSFGNLYSLAARVFARRAKGVITHHGSGYQAEPPQGSWQRFRAVVEGALGSHLAQKRVAVSDSVARAYEAYFGWPSMQVIHNGVPVHKILKHVGSPRETVRAELGFKADGFLLLIPSRFIFRKGHHVLFEAVARLRTRGLLVNVVAPGVGPEFGTLRETTARLGIANQVSFHPPRPQDWLFDVMRAADVVVIPSLSEPFGIAAAEAMAIGAPLIVSDVDGLRELVGDGDTAVRVPPGDVDALSEAIWSLHEDPELRKRIGASGRKRVENHFDISVAVSKWIQVFQEL